MSLDVLPLSALIYYLARSKNHLGAFFSTRVMILLGGASYSVYLLQASFRDWVRTLSMRGFSVTAKIITPLTPLFLVLFSIVVFALWGDP